MATPTTETDERDETERSTTADDHASDASAGRALPSMALGQVKNGRLPMLAGGVLAVRGLRDMLSRRGGGLAQTVAGLGLLGFGLRKRSSERGQDDPDVPIGTDGEQTEESLPGEETVARRSDSNEPGRNPRNVDDEPAVESATEPDEGEVQFESGEGDGIDSKPHLDDVDPKDPRYPDEGDPETDEGHVDVDVSESAMADEPNEAAGPDEEQAFPASEGTDPEPTAPEAPERAGDDADEDVSGDDEAETDDADEPGEETETGNEIDTGEETESDDADESDDDIEESI